MIELRNETEHEFTDISSEYWRRYTFASGVLVVIENPQWLHVAESGGHRILDLAGFCHYIPYGWVHLQWQPKDDAPHFVS